MVTNNANSDLTAKKQKEKKQNRGPVFHIFF